MKLARFIGFASSLGLWFKLAGNVLAQTATSGAAKGGTGTSGALPSAGSTELTYLLFLGGVILFVFGTLKLMLSFRE
ncbi:hypothetical protein A2697_00665 [Candidatus Curtissbacteria bacterium RIFCSPHIGHO2_01_FULL_41_44]|nr:MAG: hypothetical protein A2697_00665 [Candidatus Curtissbacteria bacterium RIFCSPHIGHO2_01_FULL_41_44]OGE03012.1 MAG: hypothetical protein A3G16_04790 [Candidatus Curtissbacteria bacterium RIFCSPLOWO2_12_FULL_41_16]